MRRTRREFLKDSALAAGALLLGRRSGRAAPAGIPEPDAAGRAPIETLLLNRAAFGPRPGELEELRRMGATPKKRLAAYVETQLRPDSIPDVDCERRIAQARLTTLGKPLRQLWAEHQVEADRLRELAKADPGMMLAVSKRGAKNAPKGPPNDYALRLQPVRELEVATWLRAVYSRRQLQEVMTDFWHDHFSVYAWDAPVAPVFVHYDRDVIRTHALGNFRVFLEAVAQSPAMLFYLDGFINQSANPNENYARELFELHTLGAEHYLGTRDRASVPRMKTGQPVGYVDGDVYEAARAFTGWRVDMGANSGNTGTFVYFEQWHDRFQKIVLGHPLSEYQPPMKDGRDVLDLLAAHPATARHVCLRLCRRLVADEPPPRLVEAAAQVFLAQRRHPKQLRAVVRTILTSPEFADSWGRKLKRPFEYAASALRAGGAEFFPTDTFLNNYQRLGQRHFQWRTPDGYPDQRQKWAGASSLLERWRLAYELVGGAIAGTKIDWAAEAAGKAPAALARDWCRRLLGRPGSARTVGEAAAFLARGRNPAYELPPGLLQDRLAPTLALILMSPDFQWR